MSNQRDVAINCIYTLYLANKFRVHVAMKYGLYIQLRIIGRICFSNLIPLKVAPMFAISMPFLEIFKKKERY